MFDWDGTAVPDRRADAKELRDHIEALCEQGMFIGVVTGTHVDNVDGQLRARPNGPGRLFLAVNRGSELFEVGTTGPRLVGRRMANRDEEAALDRAAALTVARLAAIGLHAEVVSQRLNRRKIDLIPLPEWSDPPKAHIDRLIEAVEERLAAVGLGGLPAVVEIAETAAREAGLEEPRVTSDAKHVEVGLTDKSDAARALFARMWQEGIGPELVLIAGDELGEVGGLPGSDSLMLVPETRGAICVSVGVEPAGVPPHVLHLCGGPSRFATLLADQRERRNRHEVPEVSLRSGWSLSFRGLDHERERAVEALLTIADGCTGTAGAPLLSHPAATPRVVVAGAYGGEGPDTDLLDVPFWERIPGTSDDAATWRGLDLHTGTLAEQVGDRATLRALRFASFARPGTQVMRAAGDATTTATHALERAGGHGTDIERPPGGPETSYASADDSGVAVAAVQSRGPRRVIDRIAVYAAGEPQDAIVEAAAEQLQHACGAGFDTLLLEHRRAWARRWARADVRIDGDDDLQLATRVALYHLMASVADIGAAAVGPRGLSGHGYRGHVLWDADVFVLPFLAATHPASARAMLQYRVDRLTAALDNAHTQGCRGARYPWESAATGHDVTPRVGTNRAGQHVEIGTGVREVHIVADVAWAASCYLDWTGDAAFAAGQGHRLFVETARYWASRVSRDRAGKVHVNGVIGPDEYHDPVDDNMFTNVMARWNLRRAVASVRAHGGIGAGEAQQWLELAAALVDGYDPSTGIYTQFAGFDQLEPLLIAEMAPRRPIAADLLLGDERVRHAQVIKQADVLMAHHLVPDECARASLVPNLEHYEPRTAHGSSLSPGVHASLFARAHHPHEARQWLRVAAAVDLDDITNTTAEGVHLATMGSVWQALAYGFAGLRPAADALGIDPCLPDEWKAIELRLQYRGVPLHVAISHEETTVDAERPVAIRFGAERTARVCGPDRITAHNA